MPVTINASTSTGLVQSADTSGVIELQTNGTTVATVNTSNNVQFRSAISVGNATPTTSGAGITFPATQSASTDANTLDDYEEGTWTPTSPTGGYVFSEASGFYTKVGRLVTVQFVVSFSTVGSNNSAVVWSGLPFTAANLGTGSCQSGVVRENSSVGAIYVADIQQGSPNTVELNSMDGVSSGSQRTIRTAERYCGTITYIV